MNSAWVKHAISEINADYQRSADTHLIRLALPGFPGIQIYLKDESTHPTGSLKHRLARSLFLYGLCNGWIKEGRRLSNPLPVRRRFLKPTLPACWACRLSP
jgi:cysteine synthase A